MIGNAVPRPPVRSIVTAASIRIWRKEVLEQVEKAA